MNSQFNALCVNRLIVRGFEGFVLHNERRLISEGTAGTLAVHDTQGRAQQLFLRRSTSKKVMTAGLRIKAWRGCDVFAPFT
jgi:hypothetical protein